VSLLYAGDRFESRQTLLDLLDGHDDVVLDRYVPSNIAHQAAKRTGTDRRQLIEWIETVEYQVYRLPRADRVILLDMPAETAATLIARKQPRSYTDHAADLQEADTAYLAGVRELYCELAGRSPEWMQIPGVRDGELRSLDDIADEIWKAVADAAGL
jgi:dTMP kinase